MIHEDLFINGFFYGLGLGGVIGAFLVAIYYADGAVEARRRKRGILCR
jgi:hypothetical protein